MSTPNVLINSDYGPIIININDICIGKFISHLGYWAKDDIELIKQLIDFLLTKKDSITFYERDDGTVKINIKFRMTNLADEIKAYLESW